ncbi:MAG: TonB-dependent receptor plug domain-containing protein, partial [Melioribacteraceae bacterium]|nr:TonB-dependent receptor plug domain-containing protein [Melioribacteraceae bacterium]
MSFNLIIKGQVNSDSTLTTSLDSIIISTTRYSIPLVNAPFSISSLENIYSKSPLSLKELFQSTSGIAVNSRSNFSQGDKLLLRGIGTRSAFGVRGIKMFLDGIPLTFPDGQSQLNNLDIQNIDKVEIVKGPSSTLYGNSLGGVVFFKSKMNSEDYYIRPEVSIGSYGYQRYGLSSGGNILSGNYSVGSYLSKSNGFREHSEAKYYGVNLNFKFELFNDFLLSLVSNYYNAPYLLNPSSINKNDSEKNPEFVRSSVKNFASGKKIDQFQNGLSLLYQINNNSKLTSTL